MLETIYLWAGWSLVAGGLLIAWWFGWRDRGHATRRCPKCWYDMRDTPGLKCTECGNEVSAEKQLHRSRRRWRPILLGALLVLAAYPLTRVPKVQRDGIVGFLPRIAVLAMWPELLNPAEINAKNVPWWKISSPAVNRILEGMAGEELSTLETRALVRSSIRATHGKGPNARAAQEILRSLGPDMGPDGARRIVDLWFDKKLRDRGPGYGRSFFTELPNSGREFLDEAIAKVRADPTILERDQFFVEWVLVQKRTIADIIDALEPLLSKGDLAKYGMVYQQLDTLPLPGEDAARIARIIRVPPKMGHMQLSYVLPQAGVADQFVADYREALTDGGYRVSAALVGVARAGWALSELQPEVEAHLKNPDDGIRFSAEVAFAMMRGRPDDVEARVFDSIRGTAVSADRGRTPEEKLAWMKESVSVAALCSGAWPMDVACDVLIKAARSMDPNLLSYPSQQAIEFILLHPEQTRKHADELNAAIRSNSMLPMLIGKKVRMYPAADAIAPGLDQAADVVASPFMKRVFRAQAAEARRIKEQRAEEAAKP